MNEAAERANRITEQAIAAGALQKPEEFSQLVRFVDSLQPSVIVEIGCDCGGTLAAWDHLAHRVIGITLPHNSQPFSTQRPLHPHGAEMIFSDSHHRSTVVDLEAMLRGAPVDFLFIDADHTYEGVRADWLAYRHLARWVGFHDLFPDPAQPNMGVHLLWDEIKAIGVEHQEFVSLPDTWGGIGVCAGGDT